MIGFSDWQPMMPLLKLLAGFASLLAIVYAFHWIAIFVHELGHVCAGLLVGFDLVEVRIGDGPRLCTFRAGTTHWHIFAVPWGGWVVGFPKNSDYYRIRQVIFIMGGPLASIVLAVVVFALSFPGALGFEHGPEMNPVTWLLTFLAVFEVFWTLWPRKHRLYGGEVSSDGLLLWQIRSGPKPAEVIAGGLQWRAVQALSIGHKEEAISLVRQMIEVPNLANRFPHELVLADVLSEAGNHAEAEEIYRRLLGAVQEDDRRFVDLVDSLGSMALYHELPHLYPESEALLRRAIARWPEAKTLNGTLGGILVEQNRDEEGRILIEQLYRLRTNSTDLGICATYLSVLAARAGNDAEVAKYRDEARAYLPKHRLVDRLIGAEALKK